MFPNSNLAWFSRVKRFDYILSPLPTVEATSLPLLPDRLSYEGTPFHRVVRGGWVQGGDIVSGDGDGGVSIYGVDFADENFSVKLNRAGILAMANDGPHTNSSQFLVTLSPQQWLNYGVVAFGRLAPSRNGVL